MKPWPFRIVTRLSGFVGRTGNTMYKSIPGTDLLLTFVVIFVVVLAVVGIIARAIRSLATLKTKGSGAWRPRQPRLSVIERALIDAKRSLVLVRRDEVEHLLMIGGEIDIVVEADIVLASPRLSPAQFSPIEMPSEVTWTESGEDDWPLQPTAQSDGVSPAAVRSAVENGPQGLMPRRRRGSIPY